ncbi:ATP-binding protein [Chamaesiphon sp. VAR_48_metabat_135_sub]|uniref:ATP-binding protein n=1 Tax=Chamaesiphon sp. VAR_48_metabat_135_sub TaxID=2964699 RepID=UPI00286B2DF3|nr:ATP-binding protein [Chamaesiphon sp. VAR_48_metabat_135_sub]
MADVLTDNAQDLERELTWFTEVLDVRLRLYFHPEQEREDPLESIFDLPPPDLSRSNSAYARSIRQYQFSSGERLTILLALIPQIRPQLLDVLWTKNEEIDRCFTEFGGLQSTTHCGFIPTGTTVAFLLAGDDLSAYFQVMRLFEGDRPFARDNILQLAPVAPGEPLLSGALILSREYLYQLTIGIERKPNFNSDFPARSIETDLDWQDLVLPAATLEQLDEIKHWIFYGHTLLQDWEMSSKLRPGFTSLFYGPPGTGKTFSACLLGKHCGCDVYKIDLSAIVSKYIGETEKNLAKIFDLAEHKQWILFFDEADALFGKRTKVEDSHDRYANQEISFLLQRIEEFNGVTILASNLKGNIDDAFIRRFQSIVYFPMPKATERLKLWNQAFSPKAGLEQKIDLAKIADKYDLSGGIIMNIVRYSSLKALSRNESIILLEDIEEGIRRELLKEGKTI